MRLFKHGSSVGQKEQAQRGDVPLRERLRLHARHAQFLWRMAIGAAMLTAANLVFLFYQAPFGCGFWLSLAAVCIGALGTAFYGSRAGRLS